MLKGQPIKGRQPVGLPVSRGETESTELSHRNLNCMAPNARKGNRQRWSRGRQKPPWGNLLREQKASRVRVMKPMGDRQRRGKKG